MLKVVGFSGSPCRPSKTRALVTRAAEAIAAETGGESRVFDIADLGPSLGAAARLDDLDATARAVADAVRQADVLVAGSPVYKASYAGMFKHFFDLLPPDCLAGKLVCLTATGGSDRHALVIEQHMRPLFAFFCAVSLPTAIFATDRDFEAGAIVSANVRGRIGSAAREAARLIRPAALPADLPGGGGRALPRAVAAGA